MPERYGIELFVQFEHDAAEKAESLRARGLTVETHAFAGGYALAISGPAAAMEALYRESTATSSLTSAALRFVSRVRHIATAAIAAVLTVRHRTPESEARARRRRCERGMVRSA